MTGTVPARARHGCAGASLLWRQRQRFFLTAVVRAYYSIEIDAPLKPIAPAPLAHAGVPYRRQVDVMVCGHAFVPAAEPAAMLRLTLARAGQPVLDVARILPVPAESQGELRRVAISGLGDATRRPELPSAQHQGLAVVAIDVEPGPDDYQSAPPDCRVQRIHGDEWIVLAGVHPKFPLVRTQLPGANGRWDGLARLRADDGAWIERQLALDTVLIDMDEWRCQVTWRGWFELDPARPLAGLELEVGIRRGDDFRWAGRAASGTLALSEQDVMLAGLAAALPFGGAEDEPTPSSKFSDTITQDGDSLLAPPPSTPFERSETPLRKAVPAENLTILPFRTGQMFAISELRAAAARPLPFQIDATETMETPDLSGPPGAVEQPARLGPADPAVAAVPAAAGLGGSFLAAMKRRRPGS